MLFNSYSFIFFFIPITVAGYFLFGRITRDWALGWLALASLLFYAWWNPLNVLIMAPSVAINYGLARLLVRLSDEDSPHPAAKYVLAAGLIFNILFLGYFKYINFARTTLNDVLGTGFILETVILPLGISFITFQKIAFLFDVHGGRVKDFTFRDFALFVLFFPQLVAGPIVHYREMVPQFQAATGKLAQNDLAIGLTLFVFGLFKKVVLADSIGPLVTPIYEQASAGEPISLFFAWMAAFGFTLQIYFDFSGYSDMALGLARLFGFRLPQNFNSPLRSSSIIDFWLRWHMTLTRFLTAYVYNPLSLNLTRKRLAKGLKGLSGRNTSISAFITLLLFPTILTMLLSGIWHGAGYTFIVWGLLHGIFLSANHAWRISVPKIWPKSWPYDRIMTPVGYVLTLVLVAISMIFFRASTMGGALDIFKGLFGLNGVALPFGIHERLGAGLMGKLGVTVVTWESKDFVKMAMLIPALLAIALFLPNTQEVLAKYEPSLGFKSAPARLGRVQVVWSPSLAWGIGVAAAAMIAIYQLAGPSEFLYWQF
jgi:alginate O-acetyltransferase complex protein AlgI